MAPLDPPKEEQVRQYYETDPVSTNPWSPQPSLDVVMAALQDLNQRLQKLEKPADEPVPTEAADVKPMQE